MSVPVRRGRPGYDLDRLLDVAVTVFNERGYDGTSMEDLAVRLGISKSAIYHHVSAKAELLRLATDRALDALEAVVAAPAGDTAIERLEYVVRGSVRVLAEELPFVTLLLRVRGNTEAERRALARRRELDHRLTDLVRAALAEGSLRPEVDPALTARLIFGTVNSLIEWYRPSRALRTEDVADAVVGLVLGGLRRSG
ncbi:MAG: TetR/AcrR family transcriptional regulator [Geodermatophilaceae bacterium]|nr:TetR/AcrR family transcriptional regulator [Geodermatophilaceae bacterium]MDQ3454608.1 TetR/AcrR family transcriptional regulator [Actinomycetota bacterium]